MKQTLFALLLAYALVVSVAGQQPAAPLPTPTTVNEDEVVRITTNLVQIDAVVMDRAGKQVTDLNAADFEIYEDGRPQEIKNLSYISLQPAPEVAPAPHARPDPTAAPAPPVQLRPEQVRRTIALVVDDLGLSFESMYFVRKSLKKFVDEQVQPGDLVAVIRTGAGIGALQQFTTDKRLLYAEALMAEAQPGAPNGFYTPEEHLYQLQGKLYRDLRVRVDTGLHTGRMSYDDAVDLFSQVRDFLPGSCRDAAGLSDDKRASCTSSANAIYRYSKWPTQAITYRLGKDQILALRADAQRQLGDRFSAKEFHLLFMRQGTIPANYFRDELLRALQQQH